MLNVFWWLIEWTTSVYILLIPLPEETVQKILLYFSHYAQGITIFLLLINMGIFLDTMIIWVEKLDFSNVFQNKYESTLRGLSGFEMFFTISNIWYLFLVYFFLVDLREFFVKQDGAIDDFILSYYLLIGKSWLYIGIDYVNNFMISLYEIQIASLSFLTYPIQWANIAIQWIGKTILDVTKWCLDIFIIIFLWIYSVLVLIFNQFVPWF